MFCQNCERDTHMTANCPLYKANPVARRACRYCGGDHEELACTMSWGEFDDAPPNNFDDILEGIE